MEEFFKTLNIKTIESLHLEYIDNYGNHKRIEMCNDYHLNCDN